LPSRGSPRPSEVAAIGEERPAELYGVQVFGIIESNCRHMRLVERTDRTSDAKRAFAAPFRINDTFRIELPEPKVQRLVIGVQLEPATPELILTGINPVRRCLQRFFQQLRRTIPPTG
jgi:hypothetical protein